MGFWPFGGSKRQRSQDTGEHLREKTQHYNPSDNMTSIAKEGLTTSGTGWRASKPDLEGKSRRMSKTRASLSTLGTNAGQTQTRSNTTPVPSNQKTSNSGQKFDEKDLYRHTPLSQSSLGTERFDVGARPPTLAKRPEYDSNLPRRKSSKRKAEDYAREREVRAMSSSPIPIPKRPATFYGNEIMQRDTKDIAGDLNKKLKRPSSRVSLPVPEALPSADGNQASFKIGTFAALSPRPTLKYDSNPRNAAGKQALREKPSIQQAIVEEDISEEQRINELADNLDAGGLRELMEKDRRRRERKKEADKAKLQRKLRRAERQKEEEDRKARTEDFVRQSTRSGEKRQSDNVEAAKKDTAAVQDTPGPSSPRQEDNPFRDPETPPKKTPVAIRNPFEDEKDMDVMQDPAGSEDEQQPEIPVRSPLRDSPKDGEKVGEKPVIQTVSPPVSPAPKPADGQSLSQSSYLHREETPSSTPLDRRASDQSSQRLSSWTNFFRRGTRRKPSSSFKGRDTPSEFSNTSRESFARKQSQQQQPPPVIIPRTYRRPDSVTATPQRTMSKFREDLPELPISPPDSRVQSPETAERPPLGGMSQALSKDVEPSLGEPGPAEITDTPISPIAGQVSHGDPEASAELDMAASNAAAAAPVSQSLASVDSEGSWLSGKPIKRQSGASSPHQVRKSQSSLRRQAPGTYDNDDEGVADDEFFSRLSPAPDDRRTSLETRGERKPSSTVLNMQEDDQPSTQGPPQASSEGDKTYHGTIGRQPTVVRQAGRAKSKEGLMQDYSAEEPRTPAADTEGETEGELDVESPGVELQEAQLMRARSVDYKGHARQISAGSAKLLDIRRGSQQSEPLTPKNVPKPEAENEQPESTTLPE